MTTVESAIAPTTLLQQRPTHVSERTYLSELGSYLQTVLMAESVVWGDLGTPCGEPPHELLTFLSGGKGLRPRFCYWSWIATGGTQSRDAVVTAGAALELLHAFALIHDDLMDESATRRGRASLQVRFAGSHRNGGLSGVADQYGDSLALLTGDLAFAIAYRLAAGLPRTVLPVWTALVTELVAGQYLDVSAPARSDRSYSTAVAITKLKSARYTVTGPMRIGAALNDVELDPMLSRFGDLVGEAFQLRDDLLGVFGQPATTGKPVGDDLRSGKATLLIVEAQRRVGRRDKHLLERIGSADLTTTEVSDIGNLIDRCGARDAVEHRISTCLTEGLENLDAAQVTATARAGLEDLAVGATHRDA